MKPVINWFKSFAGFLYGQFRKFHQTYRFLEVSYPIALAFLLFGLITYLIYAGNQRDRISSNIEGLLIRNALAFALWDAPEDNPVVVISLTEQDLKKTGRTANNLLVDAPLESYAAVLKKVLRGASRNIYMSWIFAAHERTATLERPLIDVLEEFPGSRQTVHLPYPTDEIPIVNPVLASHIDVLEGDDCQFDVQSYCAYEEKWDKWVFQNIANRYWLQRKDARKEQIVSDNLPHTRAMYLLHLPRSNSLVEYTFSDVLAGDFDERAFAGKEVFIGSSIVQDRDANGDHNSLERSYIPENVVRRNFESDSTPYHKIWALTATMFIQNKMIAVTPRFLSYLLAVAVCLIIAILLIKAGTIAALFLYLLCLLAYPFLDNWGVRYLNLYLPMFESMYFGLVTFLFTAFGRLSYQLYLRWQLEEKQKNLRHMSDLKENFISLISHNLNTPIAKMFGLAEALELTIGSKFRVDFSKVFDYLTRMQVLVRGVLITTSLRESTGNDSHITIARVRDELQEGMTRLLEKVGIHVAFDFSGATLADINVIPFRGDLRSTVNAICAPLFANAAGHWLVVGAIEVKEDLRVLHLSYTPESLDAHAQLRDFSTKLSSAQGYHLGEAKDFFRFAMLDLSSAFLARHHGAAEFTGDSLRLQLILT